MAEELGPEKVPFKNIALAINQMQVVNRMVKIMGGALETGDSALYVESMQGLLCMLDIDADYSQTHFNLTQINQGSFTLMIDTKRLVMQGLQEVLFDQSSKIEQDVVSVMRQYVEGMMDILQRRQA